MFYQIKKFKSGFTAVELIIVLSIIALIAVVSVPTISQFLPSVNLNGTTRNLTADLRDAQEKAVASQNQHLVRFFPTNAPVKYQLIRVINGEETIIKEESLPSNESLSLEATISQNQIIFSPDGGPSSSGNITLSLAGKSKIISVSPAGFIAVQ